MRSPPPDALAARGLGCSGFLGGRIALLQPLKGYRAGVDPVLLAASVPARAGHSVLELGCGAGAASLCLAARVQGLTLTGLELQPGYAALARKNAALNDLPLTVVEGDLAAMPANLRQRRFDIVIANPPYFDRSASTRAPDAGRDTAMGEDTPLADWVQAGSRRLAPRGLYAMIHRAERLGEILSLAPQAGLGSLRVLPLAPRAGRDAQLVIVHMTKGGRAPLRLHAPFILHAGDRHAGDAPDYTEAAEAILRHAAPIRWSD
ncbi:tRNA1(Val) (adenine(37)-N6)-methyltransferase [Mesobacterium pallidum]|uniref:tRNA1(Val) (adenine(37)-N6)-methyltransferase n=1 Tax=Mesobacterium pallidum TaxID=2872037 RepID=UPI001EE2CB0C|nr:methyltransferase domain-containing protein [Mesobacterium pallidum]